MLAFPDVARKGRGWKGIMSKMAQLGRATFAMALVVSGVGGGGCVATITTLESSLACTNGVLDPGETDVDCGGTCSNKCADWQHCVVGTDCKSGGCNPTLLTCTPPSCTDGRKNGDETDVDCGGSSCPQCANGQTCTQELDCQSHTCQMMPGCVGEPCTMQCVTGGPGNLDGGPPPGDGGPNAGDAGPNAGDAGPNAGDAGSAPVKCTAATAATTCNDHNPCTLDQCVPGGGEFSWVCGHTPLSDVPCDDGNVCTANDTCQAGVCTGTVVVCTASDQCHMAGTCDLVKGCSNPTQPDGTSCEDGNACTTGDSCQDGTCTPGVGVTCTADQCHTAGLCDPVAGCPTPTPKANGATCDDGDGCTTGETCQMVNSTGGIPTNCTADNCHVAGYCVSPGGCPEPTPVDDGTVCNDGDACTTGDACVAGVCVGTPVVCVASGVNAQCLGPGL